MQHKALLLPLITFDKNYSVCSQMIRVHLCTYPCISESECVFYAHFCGVRPYEYVLIVLNCCVPDLHTGDVPPVNGCSGA